MIFSKDAKLKAEMPKSLDSIEKAADLLEQACKDMKRDPFSKAGRDRLIAGSRGILQGTTAMLVSFDESQVLDPIRTAKILDLVLRWWHSIITHEGSCSCVVPNGTI